MTARPAPRAYDGRLLDPEDPGFHDAPARIALTPEPHCRCWYEELPCCRCGYDGADETTCP